MVGALPGNLPVARTEGRWRVPALARRERAHQPAAPGRGRDGGLHVSGVAGRINTRTELAHGTSSHGTSSHKTSSHGTSSHRTSSHSWLYGRHKYKKYDRPAESLAAVLSSLLEDQVRAFFLFFPDSSAASWGFVNVLTGMLVNCHCIAWNVSHLSLYCLRC